MSCRRPFSGILEAIGAWLDGEEVTGTDFWVSTGLESERDHPERYVRDKNDKWCIREKEGNANNRSTDG